MRRVDAILATSVLMLPFAGCSGTDGEGEQCAGPQILPHQSPMRFAEMYPPGDTERPESAERAPYASTLLLENRCRQEVEIQESCLIGETDEGDEGSDARHFVKEGPTPTTFDSSSDGAVRITYERSSPNKGDDVDNVAFVAQSNAENFPTLVVPICARVVGEGSERGVPNCTSPVDISDNEDRTLCSN